LTNGKIKYAKPSASAGSQRGLDMSVTRVTIPM
jgi:hypothetical protein